MDHEIKTGLGLGFRGLGFRAYVAYKDLKGLIQGCINIGVFSVEDSGAESFSSRSHTRGLKGYVGTINEL